MLLWWELLLKDEINRQSHHLKLLLLFLVLRKHNIFIIKDYFCTH